MEPDQFQMEPEPDRPPFDDADGQEWWAALDHEAQAWEAAHAGSELISIPNSSYPVDNSVDDL